MIDDAPVPDADPAPPGPPPRRRPTAGWLLRQIAFWLLVPLIVAVIWRIVTWPVALPRR